MTHSIANVYNYGFNIGLAYLASLLSRPRVNQDRAQDFGLTTLASQGSWVPRVWGKRRIGCVFAWAGDRQVIPYAQGTTGGGKGSRKKNTAAKQPIYTEAAWHILCIGPAKRLTKVWADGKIIWEGSINSTDDPSGTTVQLGNGDEFAIWWGEPDQDVDTFLSAASRVGVASRWPNVCYVRWTQKGLGGQPRWPAMDYEIEVECEQSLLLNDAGAYIDGSGDAPVKPSGVNPAHVLWEVLFADPPHGLALDQGDWDTAFLEAFAEEANTLRLPASVAALDGEEAAAVVAKIMQDHGMLLRWSGNPNSELSDLLNGLELYLPFNEGDLVTDHSGNGRDMVAGGTVAETDGKLGGGAEFEGYPSSGNYLTRGVNDTVFDIRATPGEGFTVAFWIRPASAAGYSTLLRKFTTGSGPGWIMVLEPGPGRIYLFWSPNANFFTTSSIPAGQWTHVVLKVDATDTGETVQWWINGVKDATTASYVDPGASTDHLRIADNTGVPGAVWYDGDFDEPAIWSRALSDAEIVALYNGGAGVQLVRTVKGYQFVRLRAPCLADELYDGLPEYTPIPDGMILPPLPEITIRHGEKPTDVMVFQFADASREYRDSSISVRDNKGAEYLEYARARKTNLASVVDFDAAAVLAERRAQEELGPSVRYDYRLGRAGRMVLPGDRISISGLPLLLRVLEVQIEGMGEGAKIRAVQDTYGVAASGYAPEDGVGGTTAPGGTPVADLAFTFIEVPAHLLGAAGSPPTIIVPRIRADQQQQAADLWLSDGGSSYRVTERELDVQTGGNLLDELAADDPWEIDQGPTFTALGSDIGEAEDLSADELAWRRGEQLCLIGEELFALKKVELVGGTTYRLVGLLRALYDTERAAHAVGAKVYIFKPSEIAYVQDALLTPGRALYVKAQPFSSASAVALADITAVNKTLKGKGIVPMPPSPIEVTAPALGVPAYRAGEDVVFRWSYRSTQVQGTGFGLSPINIGVGVSAPQGTFEVQVYDAMDTLVATYDESDGVTEAGWTYDNVDLQTDLGGETDFRIEVRNINGGYRSDPVELEVEFVA